MPPKFTKNLMRDSRIFDLTSHFQDGGPFTL